MVKQSMGAYCGIRYIRQRICDVLIVDDPAMWYFTYVGGQPTSDHFRTLQDMRAAIDRGLGTGEG